MLVSMELIGVCHNKDCLNEVCKYISQAYPNGPKSLMVELPPNWPELSRRDFEDYFDCGIEENFFDKVALIYERKGTKIIYSDKERKISESLFEELCKFLKYNFNRFAARRRNKAMIEVIKKEKPEVVIAGRSHTNYFKKIFPDAYYVAFEISFQTSPLETIISRIMAKPNKADKIIIL